MTKNHQPLSIIMYQQERKLKQIYRRRRDTKFIFVGDWNTIGKQDNDRTWQNEPTFSKKKIRKKDDLIFSYVGEKEIDGILKSYKGRIDYMMTDFDTLPLIFDYKIIHPLVTSDHNAIHIQLWREFKKIEEKTKIEFNFEPIEKFQLWNDLSKDLKFDQTNINIEQEMRDFKLKMMNKMVKSLDIKR
eukprot:gene8909-857_t